MSDLATLLLVFLVQAGACAQNGFGGPGGIMIFTCVRPVIAVATPPKAEPLTPRREMQASQ